MTNDEVRAQLSAYLDGELGEAERGAVESALAADAALRAELAQLRRTAELVRSLPRASAPAGLAPRVEAAIARLRQPARPWLTSWRLAAAAAACLLLAAGALILVREQRLRNIARHAPAASKELTREHEAAARPDEAAGRELAKKEAPGSPTGPLYKARANTAVAARREGDGYAYAPRPAPARAEQPAPADATQGAGRGGVAPEPTAPLVKKGSALTQGKFAATADDRGEGVKAMEEALAQKPAAAPLPPAKTAAVPPAEAAKKEALKRDSDLTLMTPGVLERKDKAPGEAFAAEQQLGAERDELLGLIERELRPEPKAGHRAVGSAGAGVANAVGGERPYDVRLAYTDLARCLAETQAALDASNLAYTIQPIGGGQFVIETTLPEPEARVLVARLIGAMSEKRQAKAEAEDAARMRDVAKPRPTMKAVGAPPRTVRLVLRFFRAEGQPAPSPTAPAEPAQQK
ncbi:MAG: zf-HC2 domain-containing protein [Planctomycetes bacterium]|nr:zf-HC2 domain-containing protein [Planctomycetota bacterium]